MAIYWLSESKTIKIASHLKYKNCQAHNRLTYLHCYIDLNRFAPKKVSMWVNS